MADGYLTHLKALLVRALKLTFDGAYPNPDFQNIRVSIEYPAEQQDYPGIWVDYSDSAQLSIVGIKHRETVLADDGTPGIGTRWKFAGYASFTVVALSSRERDDLYDELVKVFAFQDLSGVGQFRQYIEDNPILACNFDFDQIDPQGNTAAPGTPWGTDEIIYERTINMECIGEFVSDPKTGELVNLSRVLVHPYRPDYGEADPVPDGDGKGEWL